MNKTQIEWVKNPDGTQGYTWNPITGCLNQVKGMCKGGNFPCYAFRLANGRLKERYLANNNLVYDYLAIKKAFDNGPEPFQDPFYPRFWSERLMEPRRLGGGMFEQAIIPKGIFVCDMGELFGDWLPIEWIHSVMGIIVSCSQHRFYLLTKQPQNLIKFSPFPPNCWIGATCTSKREINHTLPYLMKVGARLIYLSLEPLLKWDDYSAEITGDKLLDAGVGWVIIGAQTKPLKLPSMSWVREIMQICSSVNVPVFIKNNILDNCQGELRLAEMRQEMPGS